VLAQDIMAIQINHRSDLNELQKADLIAVWNSAFSLYISTGIQIPGLIAGYLDELTVEEVQALLEQIMLLTSLSDEDDGYFGFDGVSTFYDRFGEAYYLDGFGNLIHATTSLLIVPFTGIFASQEQAFGYKLANPMVPVYYYDEEGNLREEDLEDYVRAVGIANVITIAVNAGTIDVDSIIAFGIQGYFDFRYQLLTADDLPESIKHSSTTKS